MIVDPIAALPPEVWCHILGYLEPEEKAKFGQASWSCHLLWLEDRMRCGIIASSEPPPSSRIMLDRHRLTSIEFSKGFPVKALACFTHMISLHTLKIRTVASSTLFPLSGLQNLQKLTVVLTTSSALSLLPILARLKALSITLKEAEDAFDCSYLSSFVGLTRLSFYPCNKKSSSIPIDQLLSLTRLTALKCLNTFTNQSKIEDYDRLLACFPLKELLIKGKNGDTDHQTRRILLSACKKTSEGLPPIALLDRLESLPPFTWCVSMGNLFYAERMFCHLRNPQDLHKSLCFISTSNEPTFLEVLLFLLKRGASLESYGHFLLYQAISRGWLFTTKLLVDHGFKSSLAPLGLLGTPREHLIPIFVFLKTMGFSFHIVSRSGESLLDLAVKSQYTKLQYLLVHERAPCTSSTLKNMLTGPFGNDTDFLRLLWKQGYRPSALEQQG